MDDDFYRSLFWKEERARVLWERGEECERCGCRPYSPHVHHRFGVPIDCYQSLPIEHYEVLCPNCHADHHGNEELRTIGRKGVDTMSEETTRIPKAPRLNLDVTAEIIEDSIQRNSRSCMIACTVENTIPNAKNVSVDIFTIRYTDPEKGLRYVYPTPRSAVVQIIKFDQGIKPEPFQLRLRGGSVHRSGRSPRLKELSEKQKAERESLKKTRLVARRAEKDAEGVPYAASVPERIGGPTPPQHLPSLHREYGIRAFDKIK